MVSSIQFYRGIKANLPTLKSGEPGWSTDTLQFYIGTGTGNQLVGYATVSIILEGSFSILLKKTANYTVQADDLFGNTIICNEGATGDIVITLPALTDGDKISFLVTAAHYIRVNVDGVEVFNYAGTDGAAGGYVRSNVAGTSWNITAVGKWYLGAIVGSLKYDE